MGGSQALVRRGSVRLFVLMDEMGSVTIDRQAHGHECRASILFVFVVYALTALARLGALRRKTTYQERMSLLVVVDEAVAGGR